MARPKPKPKLTAEQFHDALGLRSDPTSSSMRAAYRVLVEGATVPEAAREVGVTDVAVYGAIGRVMDRHRYLTGEISDPIVTVILRVPRPAVGEIREAARRLRNRAAARQRSKSG